MRFRDRALVPPTRPDRADIQPRMARLLVSLVEGYLLIGVVFAVPFVLRGVNRVDSLAREATWGFRVLILPGTVLLWPLLARRWRRGGGIPDEWNAHRAAARKGVTS